MSCRVFNPLSTYLPSHVTAFDLDYDTATLLCFSKEGIQHGGPGDDEGVQ